MAIIKTFQPPTIPTMGLNYHQLGFWGEPTSTIDWCEHNYQVRITRFISIESQPKKIVVEVVVVIGVGVVVVHVVAVVIPVVDTRNIHNKVWLKPGY